MTGEVVVRLEAQRVEFQGTPEVDFGFLQPTVGAQGHGPRGMRLRDFGRQLQGLRTRLVGQSEVLLARLVEQVQACRAVRGRGVSQGVRRIELNRGREQPPGLVVGLLARLVVETPAAQVKVVSLAGRGAPGLVPRRVRRQTQLQRLGDQSRRLVLQREDLLRVPLPLFRPDLDSGARVGDLDADAEFVALLADRARQHQVGADLPPYYPGIGQRVVLERHAAGRDPQADDMGEAVEDLLGHPLAEVRLIALRAAVGERQDGDRESPFLFGRRRHRDRRAVFRRGQILDHRAGEAESAPVHGGDPLGASAAAGEDLARLADRPADRRLRHVGAVPDVPEQLLLGHHPVPVRDQEGQQLEHLGLKLPGLSGDLEAVLLRLQHEGAEVEDHRRILADRLTFWLLIASSPIKFGFGLDQAMGGGYP